MNRVPIITVSALVCLAALSATVIQAHHLSDTRARKEALLAQAATPGAADSPASRPNAPGAARATAVSPELLRLRSELTRLTALGREVAAARAENERLRSQLAASGTNNVTAWALLTGFVRKADARMAGYGTPEDTLQTLLWALQREDEASFWQAFAPRSAAAMQALFLKSPQASEHFQKTVQAIRSAAGLAIGDKEQDADGDLRLEVVISPTDPPGTFCLSRINGEWKLLWLP